MLLNDIGKSPDATFKRINLHLEENYGFKISEDVNDKDLVLIMERIEDEITELKIKGDDAKASPEISKRLLVLEGLRNLREFAMMGLKSPKLEQVISNLTDFVVDTYEVTALHETAMQDFEKAMQQAMSEYRSSRYRFPDEYVENRVRQAAMSRINGAEGLDPTPGIELGGAGLAVAEDLGPWSAEGKRSSATGGHAASAPDTPQARHAAKVLDNPKLSLEPETKKQVPMIRDKSGRMVPDPFAAQAAARKQGIVMKENLVKNLRRLLETEVSQAEVMMAAKGFAQELQEMVEKIGRLQNEDLPPVTDQMRETYGMESASAFQTQIYGALQSVMDALYTAKGQVDDAVSNMATTGQVDAAVDMDKELGGDPMDDPMAMDAEVGADPDLDNIEADLDMDADEFGADEALGRSMKAESAESMKRKISEMKRLVEKARKLREATR
jgi:hypothetical protein